MLKTDIGPPELKGFYVVRYVEADNLSSATAMMFNIIRNEEYLNDMIVDGGASRPTITFEEIREFDERPDCIKSELGDQPEDIYWHFFPMNEELK